MNILETNLVNEVTEMAEAIYDSFSSITRYECIQAAIVIQKNRITKEQADDLSDKITGLGLRAVTAYENHLAQQSKSKQKK